MLEAADKVWHGVKLLKPDWGDTSHSVAFGVELRSEGLHFHLILNAFRKPLDFELPRLEVGNAWRRWIDTGRESPDDIVHWETSSRVSGDTYRGQAHSVVMLFARGEQA